MRALWTDLYELNMAASYLRRGMDGPATFSLFVRELPPSRGFLVAAGLDECLAFLETFSFGDDDLAWLREQGLYGDDDLRSFAELRFTGDVWAVPEGRIVGAGEPLLEVTAPITQAQIVETYLLNQITFQTTLASKAARCRIAARGAQLVDFAFRRTQGAEAAMAVARTSAMTGFVATSNVEAARRYGLRTAGTMAHSYIEAFANERDAFVAFAQDFPARSTFLADTYDTLDGVRTAIGVIGDLSLREGLAIRLDSGDLDELARAARAMLDGAGLPHVRIFASGGLDEHAIDRLMRDGAPIDAFGIGTKLGVSYDAPALDTAYKLVSYEGRPVVKLSPGKATLPGAKQVFRTPDGDIVGLRDEAPPDGSEPLLQPVMRAGRRTGPPDGLEAARARFERDLASLPAAALDLTSPVPVPVRRTDALERLTEDTRRRAFGES